MLVNLLAIALISAGAAPSNLRVVEEVTFTQITRQLYYLHTITIKAILPDGSHAVLECIQTDNSYKDVQSLPPEKLPPKDQTCADTDSKELGQVKTCTFKDVGEFGFKRSGDKITISHRNGKTTFKVTTSW